ncbi:MAG: esterase-like activity of phytase family protein [Planctomycetes bacterium]|nr:esterase-like activity of phytase family protein [Planctomycetota bacterium]
MKRILFALFLITSLAGQLAAAEPRFIGKVEVPTTLSDKSGEQGTLEGGIPANQWGGFGSGIAYMGRGDRFAVISDRGPADGATAYRCRYHVVDISVDETSPRPVNVSLRETHLLTDRLNRHLIGSLGALPDAGDPRGVRFDPEGIRVTSNGTLLISDEYGPSIGEFLPSGRQIGQIDIPSRYTVRHPSADPNAELPPSNTSGRQPNRGLECLAISPDDSTIYALLQSPLIQDGALDEAKKRIGTNVRLLEIRRATGATREFLYQLDQPSNGCHEIEYLAPGRLLVIERDSKLGTDAAVKKIFEINLRQATDISRIESLPATGTPNDVTPVSKSVLIDLLDPQWNLAGADFPEKIEGIAIGPRLADGSRLLIITSDNDFLPIPTQIYSFAIRVE